MKKYLPLMFLLIATTTSYGSDLALFERQETPNTAEEALFQAHDFLATLKGLKANYDTQLQTFLTNNQGALNETYKIEFQQTSLDGLNCAIANLEKTLKNLPSLGQTNERGSCGMWSFLQFFTSCCTKRKPSKVDISSLKMALQNLKPSFKFKKFVFYYKDSQNGEILPFTLFTTPSDASPIKTPKYGAPVGFELYPQIDGEEYGVISLPFIPTTCHIKARYKNLEAGTRKNNPFPIAFDKKNFAHEIIQQMFSWNWSQDGEEYYIKATSNRENSILKMMQNLVSSAWSDSPYTYTYAIEYAYKKKGSIIINGDITSLLKIRSDIFALIDSIKANS